MIRDDLMLDHFELLTVEIKMNKRKPLIVILWYRQPGTSVDLFHDIHEIILKIEHEGTDYMLMGDLNCDVISTNPHCYTNQLL